MSLREGSPEAVGSSPSPGIRTQPSVGLPSAQVHEDPLKVSERSGIKQTSGLPECTHIVAFVDLWYGVDNECVPTRLHMFPQPELGWSPWRVARTMRSAALLAATLSCAAAACLGVALLVFLFVARTFAPASAHIVRPLYFDYSSAEATATVSLLASQRATLYTHTLHELNHKVSNCAPTTGRVALLSSCPCAAHAYHIPRADQPNADVTALQNASVPHSKERFLPPGEQFTLWLELQLPDTSQSDFFQVHCQLPSDLCTCLLSNQTNIKDSSFFRTHLSLET